MAMIENMSTSPIRVCATSFLLPGGPWWEPLADHGRLEFGEYGDWPSALLSKDDQRLVWVLFLEDVLPTEALAGLNDSETEEHVTSILEPLVTRLETVRTPVVVAWSATRKESVIREARMPSPWRRICRRIEDALYDLATHWPALHLVALDDVFAEGGTSKAFDWRNYYAARCRLSHDGLRLAATAIGAVLTRIEHAAKKVLVLDCDNTLWGGVVGEAGISGIALGSDGAGAVFTEFQRAVKRLADQGVLLAVASKNNEADVWEVFDRHPGMVLKRSDLVAWRIDWSTKSDNVGAIADDLGLGLDSIVFWDDNPFERESMLAQLPEVATFDVPEDVTLWPSLIDGLDLFARFQVTSEDKTKSTQYRNRRDFMNERRSAGDEKSFLRSIRLDPQFIPLEEPTLARAEQLCAKTNQFNLRTTRYSAVELTDLANECGDGVFLTRLVDRFGDHGIIGFTIARQEGSAALLDTFLLSCRVLGRHVEASILAELASRLRRTGCRWLLGEFRSTGRNAVAADFLVDHGLKKLTDENMPDDPDLHALIDRTQAQDGLYIADLKTLSIPHLDLFEDLHAKSDRTVAEALS